MINLANEKLLNNASQPRNSIWVSAHAGSGKTKNLISRVARILLQGAVPEKILCLTYTMAAATEMKERLFEELGSWSMQSDQTLEKTLLDLDKNYFKKYKNQSVGLNNARRLFAKARETPGGLKIQTIHSFCSSVLRKFPFEINISPNFKILDERLTKDFINRTLLELLKEDMEIVDIPIHIDIQDMEISEDAQMTIFHYLKQCLYDELITESQSPTKYKKRTNDGLIA